MYTYINGKKKLIIQAC